MIVLEEGIGYATEASRIHYAFFLLWPCSFKASVSIAYTIVKPLTKCRPTV